VIRAKPNPQHRRGRNADQDRLAPQVRRQPGSGEADHHGVVTRQNEVDQNHLHKGRQGSGIYAEHGRDFLGSEAGRQRMYSAAAAL